MNKLLTVIMILTLNQIAYAEVGIDDNKSTAIFKIDGKVVSAVDAAKAAPTHEIEKCTPIKGAESVSGGEVLAVKCKVVILVYNTKTGTPHWKNK